MKNHWLDTLKEKPVKLEERWIPPDDDESIWIPIKPPDLWKWKWKAVRPDNESDWQDEQ